ncbi:unnamed protein product [Rangifer tarandus platyrhynchus]|uniref:Uncharacterized protein n=2 Tax=Rangifer tarandus platyrhynchus TaxID=3082113 RepID=A0ABN8Z649_RANTA|nr:unnamed protein product [Rangifer tarandus platyrhynchus]
MERGRPDLFASACGQRRLSSLGGSLEREERAYGPLAAPAPACRSGPPRGPFVQPSAFSPLHSSVLRSPGRTRVGSARSEGHSPHLARSILGQCSEAVCIPTVTRTLFYKAATTLQDVPVSKSNCLEDTCPHIAQK